MRGGTNAGVVLKGVNLYRTMMTMMKNTLKVLQRPFLLHCQQNSISSQKQQNSSIANT